MDKNYIVSTFCNELSERGYEYTSAAVWDIVDKSLERKKHLYDLFKTHPNWDERQLCIHFDADVERKIDGEAYMSFLNWLWDASGSRIRPESDRPENAMRNIITKRYNSYWQDDRNIYDELYNMPIATTIPAPGESAENDVYIADLLDRINALDEKWNFRPGMKLTRVVGKICKKYGWDKLPDYDKEYAKFADALTPLKISRHTTISINPVDFLLMSHGNSWQSCHYIGEDESDAGCYSSGTVSYMLDPDSFILSVIDKEYEDSDLALAPKLNRQVFGYKDHQLLQSRLYPQSCDSGAQALYDNFRQLVEEIIANAEHETNRWVQVDQNVWHKGTCYPDWKYNSLCKMWKLRKYAGDTSEAIQMGEAPICVNCGDEHNYTSSIHCEECYPHVCADCGCTIDLSDEDSYVEWDGEYYCTDCRFICEKCGELERVRNKVWISDVEEDWCDYCARNVAYRCDSCGEYFKYSDALTRTENGKFVCEDCLDRYYRECYECGVPVLKEDAELIDGEYYCEDCADKKREEIEESA